jgi:hypothetical protein
VLDFELVAQLLGSDTVASKLWPAGNAAFQVNRLWTKATQSTHQHALPDHSHGGVV